MSAYAERLAAWVATPSVTGDELALALAVEAWLGGEGLEVTRDDRNVVATVRGRSPGPRLLLNSHLDVVPPGNGWATDPFTPVLRDGRMYGRGANDAKASGVAMAMAALALHRDPPPVGEVVLALTCEEERGRMGLERVLPGLGRFDGAVIGEPTGLQPAVAQNGLLILELTTRGKQGHAARPQLAINAIDAACRDVLKLHGLTWAPQNPHVGPMTLQVTQINAGQAHNVIPGECKLVVDIRTIPEIPPSAVVERVASLVEADVHVRSDRLKPAATPVGSRLLAAVGAALPGCRPFGSPTVSDWAHLGSVPGVKIGPGISEVSHTIDEWVEVAEGERAIGVYARLARAFLAGEG